MNPAEALRRTGRRALRTLRRSRAGLAALAAGAGAAFRRLKPLFNAEAWAEHEQALRDQHREKRLFVEYLGIGAAVMLLVLLSAAAMRHYGMAGESLLDLESSVQDWLIDRFGVRPGSEGASMPPILFIDVDESTWNDERWGGGAPRAVPLSPLADLIELAAEQGAKYILTDFIVDGPSDADMRAFHARVSGIVAASPDRHFLFARSVRGGDERPRLRPSFALDKLMAEYPKQVHAFSTEFIDEEVKRHWRLWRGVVFAPSDGDEGWGAPVWSALPSAQLLIHALTQKRGRPLPWTPESLSAPGPRSGPDPVPATDARGRVAADFWTGRWVEDAFGRCYLQDAFTRADCGAKSPDPGRPVPEALGSTSANRVFFYWGDDDRPEVSLNAEGEPEGEIYLRVSARSLLASSPSDPRDALRLALFRKRAASVGVDAVAVIGASYEEAHDSHNTPKDKMPGALGIVNALATMSLRGPTQPLPSWANALLALVTIALFAASFAWPLGRRPAAWLSSRHPRVFGPVARSLLEQLPGVLLILLFFLLLTGVLLLRWGTWFNFALTMSFFCVLMKMREAKLWLLSALFVFLLFIR